MIGFDRPLKPLWIYETLMLVEPGQKLNELNITFENIARELTGKEGKRKVRTVLFRCFIRDEKNKTVANKNNRLKELSQKYGFEFMVPIYLFYLVGKTSVLTDISGHLFRLYDYGDKLNIEFLKRKMVEKFGERDVVKRSIDSFIKTLVYFHVIDIDKVDKKIILSKKLQLNEEQTSILLKLYAYEILKTPQISLNSFPIALFSFFNMPELKSIAQKYNGEYWDYQHRLKEDLLVIKINKY